MPGLFDVIMYVQVHISSRDFHRVKSTTKEARLLNSCLSAQHRTFHECSRALVSGKSRLEVIVFTSKSTARYWPRNDRLFLSQQPDVDTIVAYDMNKQVYRTNGHVREQVITVGAMHFIPRTIEYNVLIIEHAPMERTEQRSTRLIQY